MKAYKPVFVVSLTALLIVFLNFQWGPLPALGKIVNPFSGIWRSHNHPLPERLQLPGLQKPVSVRWDKHAIPHVFAENLNNLYFAQGYLVARDRLWQMDMQTRVAAARVSEVMGEKTVKMDKFFLSIGLRRAARKALDKMLNDPETRLAVESYTAGVNAYIESLSAESYPMEYKLTGFQPEKMTPIRTAYLLKIMAFRLAGLSYDLELTRLLQKYDSAVLMDLFPSAPSNLDPVINGSRRQQVASTAVKAPMADGFRSVFADYPDYLKPVFGNGSNNWAVSGKRSKTGHSIVANDTHLSYQLPAVWYEMQLSAPGLNVYGASFPSAPGIVIGFNPQVAWAVTNGYFDVMDWYELEFRDETFTEYLVEGEWKKSVIEHESIVVRGDDPIKVSLVWTDLGVIVAKKGLKGLALRWTVHEPSNELSTFLRLNRANNFSQCHRSLEGFVSPAQNFICADSSQIGLWHTGLFPKKWQEQGRFVLDGSNKRNHWQGWINWQDVPYVQSPKQGFVRSANQRPVDDDYPFYPGWFFRDSYRSQRISQVLQSSEQMDGQSMMDLQNDILNPMAQSILPTLVSLLDQGSLSEEQKRVVTELSVWDYHDRAESYLPTVFHNWWQQLRKDIFSERLMAKDNGKGHPQKTPLKPQASRVIDLIKDVAANGSGAQPQNLFWLDASSLKNHVNQSFSRVWQQLSDKNGPVSESWYWYKDQPTRVAHMARIPGLGSKLLKRGGSVSTVSANTGRHGAVWKMVVELGPNLKAWANYPGGQSGNPLSRRYEDFVDSWSEGQLRPVIFLRDKEGGDEELSSTEMVPAKEAP